MKILIDITVKLSDTEGRRNLKEKLGFKDRGDDKRPHERLTVAAAAAAAVTVVAGGAQWELVSVLLAHGRLKHKTLIEESFVSEAGSVGRPFGSCQICSQQQPTTMMMAEKRADASVKHSRVEERAHQSERRPSGKKTQKTVSVLRLPSRPPKRALTFF